MAACAPWARHERTHQHVADPALIRPFGFEAPKRSWLAGERGTIETAAAEVRTDGALGDAHTMARFEDGGDLRRRTCGQFLAQLASLLQQLRMAPHRPQIGAWRRPQSVQTLLAVGAHPAVESAA